MIISIIIKNIKIILRSPFTIILLVLAPIILMFLVGFTYSGTVFTQTQVGIIDYDGNFFEDLGGMIGFIKYSGENSAKKCREDLKVGKLDLCILFKEHRAEDGTLNSASVIYYIDNTRPQISDILIRNFNLIIDQKTKDISNKTITDIFSEMNDAITFMNESKQLVDDVQSDLVFLKIAITQIKENIHKANIEINENYNNAIQLRNTLQNEFNNIKQSNSKYSDDLNDLSNNFETYQENIQDINSDIQNLRQSIITYASVDPNIYNYVNINQINSISSNLNSLSNNLLYSENLLDNFANQINNENFNTLDKIIQGVDEMLNIFSENKKYLEDIENQIISFENTVKERENKLNQIEVEMDEKLDYFTKISNKDASNIAEPISKKNEPIFNNFKRVHQLAPTVVVLVLLFVGLLLSNILVSLEINSKAYFRNLISPISQFQFILGLFITSFILVAIQLFFLLLVLVFYFSVPIFNNFFQLSIVIIHLLFIFVLLGIFLAYFFSSVQISILVTTFVMLFMFLLSDLIEPIEIMPSIMANIISLNPVVLGGDLIRKIFYYSDLFNLKFEYLIPFYIIIIILIFGIWYASNRRKKKLF